MMPGPGGDLRALVERAYAPLVLIRDRSADPTGPGRWSPRELIGHLIDSATHNHLRFVNAQLADAMVFSGYDQDAWVAVQPYAQTDWTALVGLWRHFNLHLAAVMERAADEVLDRPRSAHNLHEIAFRPHAADAPGTLRFLMDDYVVHLQHHLDGLLG